MPGESIAAYDLPARVAAYDADMEIMHPNRAKMISVALDFLPLDTHSDVAALELGSGTGFFTRRFLEKYPRSRVTAIDGAESMTELARARLGSLSERVEFRVGDFRILDKLLSPNDQCDAVFTSYALHHLSREEKEEVVRRGATALNPGGWFLNADVIVGHCDVLEARFQELRVDGIVVRAGGRDSRFRNVESTRRWLDEMEATEGDRPLALSEDLQIMSSAGLANVSVLWLEYREAVMVGWKRSEHD